MLQVTGGSVFLLDRQWNIYLHTRELCALVLSTITLGVIKRHSNSTTRQNEIFQELARLSPSPRLWKEIEETKKPPEREAYVTEVCSTVRRIFHSHYVKLDGVRIRMDEMKYTELPKE